MWFIVSFPSFTVVSSILTDPVKRTEWIYLCFTASKVLLALLRTATSQKFRILQVISVRKISWWWSQVLLMQSCLFTSYEQIPLSLNTEGTKQQKIFSFLIGPKLFQPAVHSKAWSRLIPRRHTVLVQAVPVASFCVCFSLSLPTK